MFSLTNAGIAAGDIKIIVGMFFLIALLGIFVTFMLSVVNALGLYEMTKTLGIKSKWFAFFPFFRTVAFGKLSDCANGKAGTFFRKALLLLNVLYFGLLLFGICAFLLGFVDTVFAADVVLTEQKEITADVLKSLIFPCVIIGSSVFVYLIYRVFYYISLYRIFSAFVPNAAIAYTVVSVLLPFMAPIFLFFIKKNKPFFRNSYIQED